MMFMIFFDVSADAAAGALAATFMCPLDMMKTRHQVHGLPQMKTSGFQEILKSDRLRGRNNLPLESTEEVGVSVKSEASWEEVIFITRIDEHGEKIASSAAAEGSSPSEYCDLISQAYKALWTELLDISYDKFVRMTDPNHESIVKEFYSKVLANGNIYRADYEGLYRVNYDDVHEADDDDDDGEK